MIQLSFNLVND